MIIHGFPLCVKSKLAKCFIELIITSRVVKCFSKMFENSNRGRLRASEIYHLTVDASSSGLAGIPPSHLSGAVVVSAHGSGDLLLRQQQLQRLVLT